MKPRHSIQSSVGDPKVLFTELLIMSDGSVLAHNLTPVLAEILNALDLLPVGHATKWRKRGSHVVPQTSKD